MLKLIVNYNRKVGEPNYGSRGAGVSLECELEAGLLRKPRQLQRTTRRLFVLARRWVEAELSHTSSSASFQKISVRQLLRKSLARRRLPKSPVRTEVNAHPAREVNVYPLQMANRPGCKLLTATEIIPNPLPRVCRLPCRKCGHSCDWRPGTKSPGIASSLRGESSIS
jgi:hypothetical protein